MKLTLFKNVAKVVHFTDFFLICACSVYSHFEFELKNNNTMFTVPEIQIIRKLNLITIMFTGLFLMAVRFKLFE